MRKQRHAAGRPGLSLRCEMGARLISSSSCVMTLLSCAGDERPPELAEAAVALDGRQPANPLELPQICLLKGWRPAGSCSACKYLVLLRVTRVLSLE